jgi:GLPGLI family protein
MNYKQTLLLICISTYNLLIAQEPILQGSILFERKENVHKFMQETDREWYENVKSYVPKYRVDVFELTFNTEQSLYKLIIEDENKRRAFANIANDNVVHMHFPTLRFKQEKNVYDQSYIVSDSLQRFKWKLVDEYREIAGFNCRRATTILFDSLYIIAFYTEQIPVSSGPESFNGLPGMILGIVIPKLNFTYFATRVNATSISTEGFQTKWNKRAKPVTQKQLMVEIESALKDWGKWGRSMYWRVSY